MQYTLSLSITLWLTVVLLAYLRELVTLGAAWLLGYRDARLRILRGVSVQKTFSFVGWIVTPTILGALLAIGIPVPQWGYSRPLLQLPLRTHVERRDWLLIQLSAVPVFLAAAVVLLLPYGFLPAQSLATAMLGTVIKATAFFALLQLIPVPPFALGRAFPHAWEDVRLRRAVQVILLSAMLLDALAGWGIIGWTFGLLNDVLLAFVRLLS